MRNKTKLHERVSGGLDNVTDKFYFLPKAYAEMDGLSGVVAEEGLAMTNNV